MSGRTCPVCGTPLVIPPTGRRPVYCGTPCRQKAARARDAAARAAHDAAWARGQLTTEISRASSLATRLDSLYHLLPRPPRADDDAALAAGPAWEDDIAEAARSLARAAHRAADMAAAHARAAGACRAARATGFRSATGEASGNDGSTAASTPGANVAQVVAAAAATEPGSMLPDDADALFDAIEDIVASAHPDTAAGAELPRAVTTAVADLAGEFDRASGAGPYDGLITAARRVLAVVRAGTYPPGTQDLIRFLDPAWDALDAALPGVNGAPAGPGSVVRSPAAAAATEPAGPEPGAAALCDAAEDVVASAHPSTAAGSALPDEITDAVEELAGMLPLARSGGPAGMLALAARRLLGIVRAGTYPGEARGRVDALAPVWDALDAALAGTAEAAR